MADPHGMLKVLETHTIKCPLGLDREGVRGGLIVGGEYAWFTDGADIVLYSKNTGCVESSRSFGGNAPTDNSMEITFVQELHKSEKTMNMLLVGCSCKSFGILFVCQLPSLSIIRCIHTPSPISYITTINNESLAQEQLCDEFKVMSTILLVGFSTGAVFAVDLRKRHIENQLRSDEIVVNESSPSKLFILRKNKDSQEAKKISEARDFHLAMFINENFCNFYKKQCIGKLNFGISCLSYTEEINAVAIGYITGHFQLWDCKIMQTLYVLKKPECFMPISHITFLEQADDPHKLCYLWVIQSDNSRLPNAMMIALSYEHRTMMSNGRCSYRVYKEYNIKLKMSLQKDSGIGRCISALTLCNDTLVRKSTGMSENVGITLFAMLMEIRQNVDSSPKSYVFLFDINEWYKAKMPSVINHLKVSKSYASFVILPDYTSCLDFNIFDKTLRPFGSNFRNDVKKLYYPSSIYFECECLSVTKIIRFKHVGIQQEILDKLILKNWIFFLNPRLIFHQCLQTNLKPFFWDKTYDYQNYTLLDKLHFVISIMVENNSMSVIDECAEKWKNGTHSEVIILHLVECLWNHVMLVKQYADQLCVPLFDCSGTLDGKKNLRMLNDCLSQMLRVENFFKRMQLTDCVQIINVDLVDRVKILNLVTQYFNAIICFVNFQLLPKQIEEDATQQIIQCDFTSLIQYACKRRMEFGDLPLYLIDAIVTNEPNGNKLIQQWKHECIEGTKGLYPPSDVQCLLRIYLNAELSDQIKDIITIYFLIDVCSMQKMDEITANIFNDTFVKNEELYKLCCATWFFDHDMFEDAMLILTSNNEWMINDESWNWYHWTVLKLFVFKKQYYWAQIYLELFDIKLMNLDDHKFYVNLQIMNNHCFDALCHSHLRNIEEKKILFEYIFDRCRHTNQLKAFLNYPMDSDEKELFFSCLKKSEDTNLIQFMFLVQEKRYSEALEVYKLLKVKKNSNHSYMLTIASVLVDKIKDNIFPHNKSDINKRVFSNEEIKMTFMNCFMDNHINMKKSNIFRSYGKLCQSNFIVPDDDIVNTTQSLDEEVSTMNGVLSPLKIEKKLLKLLDTPFIQNISYLPSATNCLVVPKKKSATDNKQLSTINLDKMPQTLTFSLPDNNDIKVEKFSHKVSLQKIDSENKVVGNSDTNDLPINLITEQTLIISHKLLKDNSKIELLETVPISNTVDREEYEKLDISDSDQSVISDGENEDNFEEPDDLLYDGINVENYSDQLSVLADGENEDNLEESDFILEDENYENTDETDFILDDSNDTNNSEQLDGLFSDDVSVENQSNQQNGLADVENEENLEEPEIILDDANDANNFEQPEDFVDDTLGVENHSDETNILPEDENYSDQLIVISDGTDEDNLEEPFVILKGENYEYVEEPYIILDDSSGVTNLEQPDDLLYDGVNVENNSDQLSVLADVENEENLEEPEIILDDANDTNNFEQPEEFVDDTLGVENHSDETSILHEDENEYNLKEPFIILDNVTNNSDQPNAILENDIDENFEESDDFLDDDQSVLNQSGQPSVVPDGENAENLVEPEIILDDASSVEHNSDQLSVLPNEENEENLEEPEIILDDANDTNNSEQHDILASDIEENLEESEDILVNNDQSVENHLDQLIIIPDGEHEDNLEESDFILKTENYENIDKTDIILDDSNDTNNFEEPSVILDDDANVQNHPDQLNVIPDDKKKYSLDGPDVILDIEYKVNCKEAYGSEHETLKNKKTTKNNEMVDCDNVIYPIDSQANALENLTPCIYGLTEKNHLNCYNQIIEEENKNYICNICDGNKTSFEIKNDDFAKIVENTNRENKSSEPINFQIVENPKDLCADQNEDYLYDEYQFSNNDIFSELSSNENPIPEYGFNHLTLTENESNQLEMYDTLHQPTSDLLNESFLNNISLGTTAEANEIRDLVVDNNVEIVTDEILVDLEPSSSNTNLYNQEIKSFQQVVAKDVASQQVDINILNSATKEYAVEIQNSCHLAISSEPSKTPIIEKCPPNCMSFKDILVQEENSKLVNFVKSNSDPEIDKNLSDNLNNLKCEKNKQPLIKQIDKNIPNLRKRRGRAKCIPLTDTKLITKSRSESQTKQVDKEIISSSISSSTSDVFEDSLVSVSKKKSKRPKKIASVKHRRVCPKYVASIDRVSNNKIDLEQSGKITTNEVKIVKKIEKLLPNSMLYKDILVQEETSNLVNYVKSNSDPEIDKNLSDNFNNLKCEKNKQPLIKQIDKNIPNLRKRRGRAKCIPLTDTKLITKSKSESKTKQVDIEIISSNISSPTSNVFENSLVSVSKKRTNRPKKIALVKRSKVCPKYVASIDRVSNSKIDLEQSGEITTNEVKIVKKIEKLLPNSMLYKDILVQEETSNLVNYVKSNSDPEIDKNLSENFNNLTYEKNKQPLMEQIDKNIPNLRKRRGRAKCIPLTDTKLITKSKSESKTKQVDIEIISSNISSSTSDVFEDSLVSVSKKKSKRPKKIASVKHRRVCPKYVASIDRVSNNKIDLEQSGKITTNEVKIVKKIEKLLPNCMSFKDILVQEETSNLVNFVKNNSVPEIDKNLSDNFNNLKCEKNKQPLIKQIDKNIPNLRKRRGRAKCIPLTDTKLITKSKSESKTKQVDIEIISSNISSPASNVFENSLVSVSKKRTNRPKKIALVKRSKVCPKYVASIDRVSNSKIDLGQSGEISTNKNKNFKKIEKLLPNNLPNKESASQEKLKKLTMPTKIKLDSENNNKIINQNTISSTKNFKHLFFLEPKIILERFDISLFKNCFKQFAVANDSSQATLSINKTNSQKPAALKRLRNGCLKSIKEPTAINTIIALDEELKEDSINNDKNKAVTRKSKLNSSYEIKKVKLDKNLKSSSDRLVLTLSKSGPINCVNKIHNSLIKETIDLISDDEVQEEMGKTSSDEEKLDWRIISHEVKPNTDAIPKIRIRRNKSEINTKCVGSLLELKAIKEGTKIVQDQELGHIKKSSESKMLKLNQEVRRMSSRKVLKKQTCSCCTSKLMDVACSSNVL